MNLHVGFSQAKNTETRCETAAFDVVSLVHGIAGTSCGDLRSPSCLRTHPTSSWRALIGRVSCLAKTVGIPFSRADTRMPRSVDARVRLSTDWTCTIRSLKASRSIVPGTSAELSCAIVAMALNDPVLVAKLVRNASHTVRFGSSIENTSLAGTFEPKTASGD